MIIKEYIIEDSFYAGYCARLAEEYAEIVGGEVSTYLCNGAVHFKMIAPTPEDAAFIERIMAAAV